MTPTNLKSARKALGLSQRGLAEALGYKCGGKDISRMEAGTLGIFPKVRDGVPRLLRAKMIEAFNVRRALRASSEPVSATHSERLVPVWPKDLPR